MYKPQKKQKQNKTEKVHVSKPSASSDQLHCMNMSCAKSIKTKEKKTKQNKKTLALNKETNRQTLFCARSSSGLSRILLAVT